MSHETRKAALARVRSLVAPKGLYGVAPTKDELTDAVRVLINVIDEQERIAERAERMLDALEKRETGATITD